MPERSPEHTREINPRESLIEEVKKLAEEKSLVLTPENEEIMREQIEGDKRYICLVCKREEEGKTRERFLKIPIGDDPEDIDLPFRRQILFGKFLKEEGSVLTRDILESNTDRSRGLPFAVMETLPEQGAKIVFIASFEDMELLTEKEARSCVQTMQQLHEIKIGSVPPEVLEVLPEYNSTYDDLYEGMENIFTEEVTALDSPEGNPEPYGEVMNRRLGVSDFKERALGLVRHWEEEIRAEENQREVLFHGDLSPSNLYVYDTGDVEFLDLEWSGKCKNEAIAAITDFGNLRARAWNNKEFREELDKAMIESYRLQGREKTGRAIVSLGILRSHLGLAGCFENYSHEKQRKEEEKRRRESTEADIIKAWEVAGVEFK